VTNPAFKKIVDAIYQERHRQEQLKAEGKFKYSCADLECSDMETLAVLVEEVGEAATASLKKHGLVQDGHDLRGELVQVAAVAVAWIEKLDRQAAMPEIYARPECIFDYCPAPERCQAADACEQKE
jgi:NTP pyrophosphatase (non-canonical NTP hydrolase)